MRLIFLLLLVILALPSKASNDTFLMAGQEHSFLVESAYPLDSRFSSEEVLAIWRKHTSMPHLRTTDVRRQYATAWEIEGSRLLLRKITWTGGGEFPLTYLFPGQTSPIFADWFSGILLLGKGEFVRCELEEDRCVPSGGWVIPYIRYKSYLQLEIQKGYLTSQKEYVPPSLLRR